MCLYVRPLRVEESQKLSRWLRQSKSAVQMRRAQVIAFSGQGMRVQQIASQLGLHEEYVRQLIRQFNEEGLEGIASKGWPPRAGKLTEEERSIIVEIATAPPQAFGRPFNQWSLRKLHRFLVLDKKMVSQVSYGTIRNVLKKAKVSFQRSRTWKRSNDPRYHAKKNASLSSTRRRRPTA